MKYGTLLSALGVLWALSGCSEDPPVLACDGAQTTSLVKEAVHRTLLEQAGADDSVDISYQLHDIQTLENDTQTGGLLCRADLAVNLKNEYMDETLTRTIHYSAELSDEDMQQVQVFEDY
ncbi:hypothetical protein [Oceanisphaera sp. W20_SRM_FM3]|uniref:hypothetical protein n=1 Tax=Oceanisphaera sp. W20_SRM_FM3 TaxID=3240267 RepID=UPI003F99D5BE